MTRILVSTTETVTLVGGGPVSATTLARALDFAPRVIAADSGADRALAHGITPTAIIGDMDSLSKVENWQNSDVEMFEIEDQDTTDFEKCLNGIVAPLILGVGFLGARVDHALAAMNALVKTPRPVVLLGETELLLATGTDFAVDLPEGATVSLFPFAPVRGLASDGLVWSVAGLDLAPDGRVGTSNRALGGTMRVSFDRPGILACLPLESLAAVVRALSTQAR